MLLANVVFAMFVCALAVQAGAVRVVFAMARDRFLPYSRRLAVVSPVWKTPVLPVFLVGAAAMTILIVNINLPKLVELVTMVAVLWANLAYLIVTAVLLKNRLEGWPDPTAPGMGHFSLGRSGLPINIAALIWSAFMVVNVGWPRAAVYGSEWQHRFAPAILTVVLVAAAAGCAWVIKPQALPREDRAPLEAK